MSNSKPRNIQHGSNLCLQLFRSLILVFDWYIHIHMESEILIKIYQRPCQLLCLSSILSPTVNTSQGQLKIWFKFQDSALSELVDAGYIFVLPDRDQHGRRVIFSQAAAFDSSKYNVSDLMRAHVMTFETLLNDEENQVRGFTYIFDEKDVSWSHISIWTPTEVSKAFSCCERALPMRHKVLL